MPTANTNTNTEEIQSWDETLEGESMEVQEQEVVAEQQLLDLEQLTADIVLADKFQFTAKTPNGPVVFTAQFERYDDTGDIKGLTIGTPKDTEPIRGFYEAKAAMAAIASLERHELIDVDGLILDIPYPVWDKAYAHSRCGFVVMNYTGEYDVPGFSPRKDESYTTGWGELIKTNGQKSVGFIAVKQPRGGNAGKRYQTKQLWIRAQAVYNECEFTMRLFAEGGATIWLGPKLNRLAKYYHMLWNLASIDPEKASEVAKSHYNHAVKRNALRFDTQTQWVRDRKAETNGTPREKVTEIDGVKLVENAYYSVVTPSGIAVNGFTFSLTDANVQAKVRALKARVEERTWKLVEAK